MKNTLVIAPPNSGKTNYCIQRILELKRQEPIAKVWIIVPDQPCRIHFQTRLAQQGGASNVHVGSFRNFYKEILDSSGVFTPIINPILEKSLIRKIVEAEELKGHLPYFSKITAKPGFATFLEDLFAELRGAYVCPTAFSDLVSNGTPSQSEISRLYQTYISSLDDYGFIDPEGQGWLVLDALQNPTKKLELPNLVLVDGFTVFSGLQRKVLAALSACVEELIITLSGNKDDSSQVYRKSKQVIEQLESNLPSDHHYLPTKTEASSHLQELGQSIFGQTDPQLNPNPMLKMLELNSVADECREALRWIKARILRDGLKPGDCAIFLSQTDIYRPQLQALADEASVRLVFYRPVNVLESSAIKALQALLKLPMDGFRTRGLMSVFYSPYFDFGLTPEMVENLNLMANQSIIVSGREQWEESWQIYENLHDEDSYYLDEDHHKPNLLRGVDIASIREAFNAFWELFDDIDNPRSLPAWVNWLEKTLESTIYFENLESDFDYQTYQTLGTILNTLRISDEFISFGLIDYAQFVQELENALASAFLEGTIGSATNAVHVNKILDARGARYKAVAILGLSEGQFPIVEKADPILAEVLRAKLGLEPRLGREQTSIFHQAITRADEYLLLTRSYLSENGESWDPSSYWNATKNLYATNPVEKRQPYTPRAQADAFSSQELLLLAQLHQRLDYEHDDFKERQQMINHGARILSTRRSKHNSSRYDGNLVDVKALIQAQFSPTKRWSASSLEMYMSCPYNFFLKYVIGIQEPVELELGLNAAQRGSIYHAILESVYREYIDSSPKIVPSDLLEKCASEIFATAPTKLDFRTSPLWEVEQSEIIEILTKTIDEFEKKRDSWEPILLEWKFGFKEPYFLQFGDTGIYVRGTVDRVDSKGNGVLRVVDYKSGSGNLSQNDLIDGKRLQITIYAKASQDMLGLGEVTNGFYWVIGGSAKLQLDSVKHRNLKGIQVAYELLEEHLTTITSGVSNGDFLPKPPRAGCPSYCPGVAWCWQYKSGF